MLFRLLACAFSPLYAVNVGKIIGGVIGGLIALLALITIIILIVLKLRGLYYQIVIDTMGQAHAFSKFAHAQKLFSFLQ